MKSWTEKNGPGSLTGSFHGAGTKEEIIACEVTEALGISSGEQSVRARLVIFLLSCKVNIKLKSQDLGGIHKLADS